MKYLAQNLGHGKHSYEYHPTIHSVDVYEVDVYDQALRIQQGTGWKKVSVLKKRIF